MKSIDANQSSSVVFPCMLLLFLLNLSLHTTANPNNTPGKRFISVSGKVTSANDQQPLQGVSVTVKGSSTGTATDAEGLYRFSNVDGNATLVFSIVGYQAMEVPIKNRNVIDVSLQVEAGTLMETIVTANAIRRDKRSLGYSAPVVKSDELLNGRSSSPLSALQGKVAGVNITSVGGAPNSSTRIVLRGGSSISGNNQALIVVDGVPIDNSDFLGGSDLRTTQNSGTVDPRSTVNFGNRGNDINPEDIESVTVLKGPTAAALYGSRASNGAVVITTKSGRKGQKNEITVSSTVTFSDVLKLPKLQNGYGQGYQIGSDANGNNEYYNDPKENWSWGFPFNDSLQEWGQEINGVRLKKPYSAQEDNIRDFFELGKGISNTVSFAGSGEKTTFYLSLNSLNSDGIMPTNKDKYDRYNVRFNGNANFTNSFSASVSINYSRINSNLVQGGQGPGSVFDNVLQTPRDIPLDKMDDMNNPYYGYGFLNDRGEQVYGNYAAYTISPYWLLANYRNENDVDRVVGNFTITWKPLKWLNIVERIGADVYSDRRRFKYPKFSFLPWDETTGNYGPENIHSDVGQYRENTFNVSEVVHDLMVTAKKDFGTDFTGSLMIGHNLRQRTSSLLDASTNESFGLIVPGWYNLDNSNGPLYNYNEYSQRRLMGLYAQATVGYKDMIFLDLTARNDWSSTLPENNNSFFYPSASASFVFSELLKDGKLGDIINYGKVRASVAQVGNDANPFLLNNYYARAEIDGSFGSTTFPFNGVPGLTRYGRIGNSNLKPEITTAYELGAEMNLWNNRLYVDFSVYKNRSKDQILTIPISEASGFTSKVINGGIVENKGVEISLRGTPIRTSSGFSLELYGTYTHNRNKVVDLQQEGVTQVSLGGLADMTAVAAEGKPYGTFYGVDVQHDDQGRVIVDPKTGIPLQTPSAVYFDSYNPKYIASLGANIRYQQWSFNVLFDRKSGGQFVSRTKDIIDFNGTAWETAEHGREPYVFPNSVYLDPTNKLVENTSIKMLPQNYFSDLPYGRNVIDASYVKLREISLSYKLKKSALKNGPFGDLTFGLFGNNLFLWVPSANKYVDPEINSAGATNLQGFDFTAQPSQRNFGFNISASF
ncbi:SusC/RagA family TonB-linked outer membrane protein [Niastella yeongjuensis]|uniref:SusC/RagA family TonB-linked outer membrane protein n=1 Tax=Niastella yeongjuensis TaxID=354355 RepID=A0A1V9ESA4_9BACT|nr:SusC/RagA family TonB-linked outer membrane protein [Niastella yeongjuensis]OQP48961.1 SusC/RagA family TonB-linked outer membrane protein [Niastella yeongjuensis]SEP09054.1 TonB-linked outer membrane protein, SusC/RagA family [Niastella yeongjuensis]